MENGCFQTHRGIFEHPIWKNILEFRLFFFLYGNAVWKEEGVEKFGIKIARGQILRSYRKLQEDLEHLDNNVLKRPSISQISRAVDALENDGRVKTLRTNLGTLFTIVNYEQYQGFEQYRNGGLGTNLGTGLEHTRNNKKKVLKRSKKDYIYTSDFEQFWDNYPKQRRLGKVDAFDCWQKRLEEGESAEEMIVAAKNYAHYCLENKTEPKYIKHPSTFLGPKVPFKDFVTRIETDDRWEVLPDD
jgi:hypothetical protein